MNAIARRRRASRALAALLVAAHTFAPLSAGVALAQATPDPRVTALEALATAKMKEYGIPGVALGIIDGNKSFVTGLGVTNVEDPLPVSTHTVFPIASISKTFAATAVMRLVEQGKLDLRAPVRTYLPDFRVRDSAVSKDVTVWHLLTHLGGWEGQVSGPDRGTETLTNFLTTITDLMQVAPPSKAWSYNNAGFSIAGRVIEVANGTSINRAVRDLVFTPLKLELGHHRRRLHRQPVCGGSHYARRQGDAQSAVHAVGERHRGRRRHLHDRPDRIRAIPYG
jgi:CubicO group peptidase (beta-lactamase class C family)